MARTKVKTQKVQKVRGFEVVEDFKDAEINLPARMTTNAAGYDFEAGHDIVIPPFWASMKNAISLIFTQDQSVVEAVKQSIAPKIVHTGVKAYMGEDEVLMLHNRSSNPIKNFLLQSNGVGVIDSDYYNNPGNEGEIAFQFYNFGLLPKEIKKGDRIGQGVFQKFLFADGDGDKEKAERTDTSGSTGK